MAGNFDFVKAYDNELYSEIIKAEKKCKIDVKASGSALRGCLEKLCNNIVEKFSLTNDMGDFIRRTYNCNIGETGPELYQMLRFLSDRDEAERLKKRGGKFADYKALPDFRIDENELRKYRAVRGGEECRFTHDDKESIRKYRYALSFIRVLGNNCTHIGEKQKIFKICYENLRDSFYFFHRILNMYFCDGSEARFSPNLIPFDSYSVLSSRVPPDALRTQCRREYIATRKKQVGADWALIREYVKEDIDENLVNFVARGEVAQLCAPKGISGVPEGMVRMQTLSSLDNEDSPFYIIAYIFDREPHALRDVLPNLSFSERYNVCLQVARCFANLHRARIYHRMFNHNCISVCDYTADGSGWVPAVTKLEFSKLGGFDLPTVGDWAESAKAALHQTEEKYIADEWKRAASTENVSWEKIDVFALGVLFEEILMGKVGSARPYYEDLEDIGVSAAVNDLIGEMTSSEIEKRPSVAKVVAVLEEEKGNN